MTALPTGFIDRTTPDEDRPVFIHSNTGDEIFVYPPGGGSPRFSALARIGGRVLEIHTDDLPKIEAFLGLVAEWREANSTWYGHIAALGGYLNADRPARFEAGAL